MKILKKVVWGIFLVAAAQGFSPVEGSVWRSAEKEKRSAPDFSLETLSGKTVSLKDLRGKNVILLFFTTWCPACRKTIATVSKDHLKFKGDGVEFLVIDAGESTAKVESFKRDREVPFDILLDPTMTVSNAYGVMGIPAFFLISKDGAIIYEGHELPRDYRERFAQANFS